MRGMRAAMVLVAAGLLGATWWVARNHEADVSAVFSVAAEDAPAAPRSVVVHATAPRTESVAVSHTRHAVQPPAERDMPFTITGIVVDVDELPAAGVEVAVRNSEHVVSAVSDPQGRFRLVSWESTQEAQVVLVACDGEPDDASQSVAWGSENVRLVWRRGLRLEVVVRQAGVGTPLSGCEVRLRTVESFAPRVSGGSRRPVLVGVCRTGADGVARFVQLPPRECVVVVARPRFVALDLPLVQLGGTPQRRVEVALASTIERVLTVHSNDGHPLAGVAVDLTLRAEATTVGEPSTPAFATMRGAWPSVSVATALTDDMGRCKLRAPPDRACTLRLDSGLHAPFAREGVVLANVPDPWVEELAIGGVVEGRLGIEVIPIFTSLRVLRSDGSGDVFPGGWRPNVVAADGAFCLRGIPPGAWQLQLMTHGDGIEHLVDVPDLRDGETRQVTIDGGLLRRAEASGTLAWNGRPHSGWLRLVRVDAGQSGFMRDAPVEGGRFCVTLVPGRYRATIAHGTGGSGGLPVGDELLLAPGSKTECALHLRTRAVRVRLLRHNLPLVSARVRAIVDARFELNFDPTDDHGCSEFAVPLGVHPLVGLPRQARDRARVPVSLGSIEVSAGEGPQTIDVNVPPEFGR